MTTMMWFRRDLRLTDNPAWQKASQDHAVLPVFLIENKEDFLKTASAAYLYSALLSLSDALDGHLLLKKGALFDQFISCIKDYKIDTVVWNRVYEPDALADEARIIAFLEDAGINHHVFDATLLWHPERVVKSDGTPYKVFTPFYKRGCLGQASPRKPIAKPKMPQFIQHKEGEASGVEAFLKKQIERDDLISLLNVSEGSARKKLMTFLSKVSAYATRRNLPGVDGTSSLSADIHFGTISPHQIWHAVSNEHPSEGQQVFLSELGWREFSYYLLYHFPHMVHDNLNKRFDGFAWCNDPNYQKAWQEGLTGYPLVDAGMRQLKKTGYMHNRVRMIVGSFLVKNLLQDWRVGATWFSRFLLDADLASNTCGWQWVAGSGADAAPYFRVFNPTRQARDYDPQGVYIRHYVPELRDLPLPYLFEPWTAPDHVLSASGVELGSTYPRPIVDLKVSRTLALQAYAESKKD